MRISSSKHWLIYIGIILMGLLFGYFIQPESLNKYVGKVVNGPQQILADGQRIEYIDIDEDGISEEIIYYHLSDNRQPVISQYSYNGEFQNVWYLDGEVAENFDFISGDYNKDSIKEIYVFSYFQNGLYLYGLHTNLKSHYLPWKLLIHQFDNNVDFSHVVIHSGGITDLNNDGFGEVVFSVNSRFSPTPRRIFAYDIANNKLLKSPELGLQLVGSPIIFDIDNDSKPEIFLSTLNSTNQAWTSPRDQALYSASIVLKSDLNYFMVPSLYESRMSVSSTFPYVGADQNYIACLSWPLRPDGEVRLMLLNKYGEIVHRKIMPTADYIFDPRRREWDKILIFNRNGIISQYDDDLNSLKKTNFESTINQVAYLDIDNDNTQEIIIVQNNMLKIYRNNLHYPVSIDIPGLNVQKINYSIKKNSSTGNLLSIQNYNQQYLVSYSKNRLYWLRYLIYLGTVLFFLLAYSIVIKIHFSRVNKIKNENESFYLMQMDLIRNQLDPHFLFNALNSISFSINKDERKTAYSNLGVFSKFLRESIITLDDFSRSLEEEIDYVKNYLTLEKFRFKEKFDYDIIVSPGVNKAQKVPKLILFSFIESALKKSVLPNDNGGRIEVTIDNYQSKGIYILISDTGLYRDIKLSEKSHTKNMLMMNRIVTYFNQFNAKKIDITYKNNGTEEKPKDSSIEITIPAEYKYIV